MKKLLVSILVAAMVGATLTGCGGNSSSNGSSVEQTSSVSAKEVVDKLTEQGFVRMPMPIDDTMAKDMFGLNLDDIENYGIIQTGISPGPGLIMVVKAKSGKVDAVKAQVEKYLETTIGNAFYPEEKELAEKAKVNVDGDLVSLFILNPEVAADAQAAYEGLIK